jgi:hypothetical protein
VTSVTDADLTPPEYDSTEHAATCDQGYCAVHDADPWDRGGYLWEKAQEQHLAEYADLRCQSFQDGAHERLDGSVIWHFEHDCGAPHCPWFTPLNRAPVGLVPDHSLGSRDELLSHIQRCADSGMDYDALVAEADRVQVALRPGDPWTMRNGHLGGMITGALEKAPGHIAENKARADAADAAWEAMFPGVTRARAPEGTVRGPRFARRVRWQA